jgi:hypothetical protein
MYFSQYSKLILYQFNPVEPVSKRSILFKVKEGENFNRRRHEVSALVNILNISRNELPRCKQTGYQPYPFSKRNAASCGELTQKEIKI